MPEIQREAVHGTNPAPAHGEVTTNRPADYTFSVQYKLVHRNKNTQ